jgi:hypothetical protein
MVKFHVVSFSNEVVCYTSSLYYAKRRAKEMAKKLGMTCQVQLFNKGFFEYIVGESSPSGNWSFIHGDKQC